MFSRLFPNRLRINLIFIRSYAPRRRHINPNPGINRQIKLLDDVPEQIIGDPESISDFETDFMNVHESHKQYEKETLLHKEKIRLWITKNKYFKVKQPNLLTFAEKEQIKLLYNRDPEEWTPEKLSESFPADYETIKKLIKSKWIPQSKERILKHDRCVMRNWTLYKEGKLNLSDDLKEHIDKFADRKTEDIQNTKNNWDPKPSLPIPKINEFSKIISSCKKYSSSDETKMIESSENFENNFNSNDQQIIKNHNMKNYCPGENETFLLDKVSDKRYMRFDDVKKIKNLSINENNEPIDSAVSNNVNDENKTADIIAQENPFKNTIKKFENNEVTISEEDMKKYDVTTIKQKICIPRKLWRKNATYKIEDCYYDFDGAFLYRVPGMTGKNLN